MKKSLKIFFFAARDSGRDGCYRYVNPRNTGLRLYPRQLDRNIETVQYLRTIGYRYILITDNEPQHCFQYVQHVTIPAVFQPAEFLCVIC